MISFYRWRARGRSARGDLVLDGLTLRPHVGEHGAHLANAHSFRNLDLDLIVVDHLGDAPDQPAIGDDGIARAARS